MAAPHIPMVSVEEYLRTERAAEFKHEFYRGRIIAMAGGSANHSLICASITIQLWPAVKGKGCRILTSDARVAVDPDSHYCYPDVSVICGEIAFSDTHRDTITNPVLLVEVLSPSTELSDRVRKLEDYQAIPSLSEYLLVSQFKPRVELYRRQADGSWSYHVAQGLDAHIMLQSVSADLNLADIYTQIEFAASE